MILANGQDHRSCTRLRLVLGPLGPSTDAPRPSSSPTASPRRSRRHGPVLGAAAWCGGRVVYLVYMVPHVPMGHVGPCTPVPHPYTTPRRRSEHLVRDASRAADWPWGSRMAVVAAHILD